MIFSQDFNSVLEPHLFNSVLEPHLYMVRGICVCQQSCDQYHREFRLHQEAKFLAESLKVERSQLRHYLRNQWPPQQKRMGSSNGDGAKEFLNDSYHWASAVVKGNTGGGSFVENGSATLANPESVLLELYGSSLCFQQGVFITLLTCFNSEFVGSCSRVISIFKYLLPPPPESRSDSVGSELEEIGIQIPSWP